MRPVRNPSELDEAALARALGQLQALVRHRGLKASGVRESIAKAALSHGGHWTIDELAARLPGAHSTTVYRTIPLLVDAGLLQIAPGAEGEGRRYERAFEREHHDHLVCTNCHKVVEFCFETIEMLQRDVAERFDFSLTGHVHELFGTCSDCRARVPR
ncbi:MAG TPA: transcriptional repressor [Polyangiaceae bacterium]|nr:transcriptional repressor [Polyangiaceae bacterium]